MTKHLACLSLLGVLLSGGRAFAVAQVDYDGTPLIDWAMEKSMFDQCGAMGRLGPLTCKFDQASFDAHYLDHKKRLKFGARDLAFPHDYCQDVLAMLNGNQATSRFHNDLAADKPAAEFTSKVKTFTCVYDEDPKKSPSFTLENGNLIARVKWTSTQDPTVVARDNSWMLRDLAKLFPAFKERWNERHPQAAQ